MQNKPNVKDAQINVNSYMKSKYEKLDTWLSGKNKPNSNPNKPNCRKGKIDAKCVFTKDYRKKDDFIVRINKPNSNPISVKPKMSANVYVIEDYENEPPSGPKKTNPNKANSNPIKACPELAEALSAAEGAVEWANFFKGQNELRNYPNNRGTPIPALPKVFDGSINFDIIASRYKNIQSKINTGQLIQPVNAIHLTPIMTESKIEESSARSSLEGAFLKHLSSSLPDSKTHLIFWSLMLGGLALDLWSKKVVFDWLGQQQSRSVSIINDSLRFVIAVNDGAAFGLFSGNPYLLAAVSIIALVVIFSVFLFARTHHKLVHIALALFAAGVCGNLYDRIFNDGSVRDFIDVYYRGYHWPAFNVADSLLCIGVGLLIISTFFTEKSSQKHAQQHK